LATPFFLPNDIFILFFFYEFLSSSFNTPALHADACSTHNQWQTLAIIVGGAKKYYIAVEVANLNNFIFFYSDEKWYEYILNSIVQIVI
jgi:hypothetical protein